MTLEWDTDKGGTRRYVIWANDQVGQVAWVGDYEQGPFDTNLEVAQWAWRVIARALVDFSY